MGMNDKDSKDGNSPFPWSWKPTGDVPDKYKLFNGYNESDAFCIFDKDGFIASEIVSHWERSVAEKDVALMTAAPELREELEKLVKRTCQLCAAETKAAITPQKKPCESGRPCPYGLDGARQAIAKSYGQDTTITDCKQ